MASIATRNVATAQAAAKPIRMGKSPVLALDGIEG
jgi:hypothetical protein